MKAEDLRIGNYVFGVSDRIEIIREIHFKGGIYTCPVKMNSDFKSNVEDLSGIQLTPELLVKCGFEKTLMKNMDWREYYIIDSGFQHYGFSIGNYDITNPNIGIMWVHHPFEKDVPCPKDDDLNHVMDWPEGNHPFSWHISYLHQLQNLYFALTGEELKIEL